MKVVTVPTKVTVTSERLPDRNGRTVRDANLHERDGLIAVRQDGNNITVEIIAEGADCTVPYSAIEQAINKAKRS